MAKSEVLVKGLREMGVKLNHKLRKAEDMGVEGVYVGYAMPYALIQHENLDYKHAPGKSAKFISKPARSRANRRIMAALVVKVLKQKKGYTKALLRAAKYLEVESQKIVPVDTGALHDSAFHGVSRVVKGKLIIKEIATKTKLMKKIAKERAKKK